MLIFVHIREGSSGSFVPAFHTGAGSDTNFYSPAWRAICNTLAGIWVYRTTATHPLVYARSLGSHPHLPLPTRTHPPTQLVLPTPILVLPDIPYLPPGYLAPF